MKTVKVIPFNDIFSSAVETYVDHFALFFRLSVFGIVPILIVAVLLSSYNEGLKSIGFLIGPAALGVWLYFSMALLGTVSLYAKGKEVVLSEVLIEVWSRFPKMLAVFFLFLFLLFVGTAVLFLPAIYVLVVFFFALFAVLFENKSILDAFKRSKELTNGIFWKLLGAHVVMLLLFMVVFLPMSIAFDWIGVPVILAVLINHLALALLCPLLIAFYYFLFIDLKQQRDGAVKISVYAKNNTA